MRILVRRMAALGDVLNTTPIVRRLKQENPESEIYVQTLHGAAYAMNPNISGIVGAVDDERWDRVVDLDMVSERNRRLHQIDAFMLEAFGDTDGDKAVEFVFPKQIPKLEIDWSRAVVVHPNTSWASRTMPKQWWQATADLLVSGGLEVIVTGTAMDKSLSGLGIHDLRDQLPLAMQAEIISQSCAILCGPSGINVLAGATETPIVSLCTITHAKYMMPYRRGIWGWNYIPVRTPLSCYACYDANPPSIYYECNRGDNACTTSFDPKGAADAVRFAIRNDMRYA